MIALPFCLLLFLQDTRTPIKTDTSEQQVFERMAGLIASGGSRHYSVKHHRPESRLQ